MDLVADGFAVVDSIDVSPVVMALMDALGGHELRTPRFPRRAVRRLHRASLVDADICPRDARGGPPHFAARRTLHLETAAAAPAEARATTTTRARATSATTPTSSRSQSRKETQQLVDHEVGANYVTLLLLCDA